MNQVNDRVFAFIEKLPKQVAINVLIDALDEMQSYNGQSQTSAICRALRADETDGDSGTSWKLPAIAETIKNFS